MQKVKRYDLIIIGAGPAGLSAALTARAEGIESLLVLDRLPAPGGILSQCLHRGFGTRELSGMEFAEELMARAARAGIEVRQNASVSALLPDGTATVFGGGAVYQIRGRAVILASGARERPAGHLPIVGTRPAGVFTAGSVQKMLNLCGYHVGHRAVILGSGDVGVIVAHHLRQSGAAVLGVFEQADAPSCLPRNKRLYIDAHSIPLVTGCTVTRLHGTGRLSAVTLCDVDGDGRPLDASARILRCDTLVTSVGLIPERELSGGLKNAEGKLPPWLFPCGNAERIFSLIEPVMDSGREAGRMAAAYLRACHK